MVSDPAVLHKMLSKHSASAKAETVALVDAQLAAMGMPTVTEMAAAMREMEDSFQEARVTASPWGGLRSTFRSILERLPGAGKEAEPQALSREQAALFALYPAAKLASQLRGMGIRLVAEPRAIQALDRCGAKPASVIDVVVGNLLPAHHPEVRGGA